ncbi:MAG: UbiX family flavin prenyltransferase [Saprospiraceae bacterium]|nr:UbiX family flavin prenyltransferase [Saprospiraceae bacterium]
MQQLVIGITGASGAIYAKRLLDKLVLLSDQWSKVGVVMTHNGLANWELEVGKFSRDDYPFAFYDVRDFNAPFASGSAQFQSMIICPCSMGMLARVSQGVSNDLITRSADVILKERRRLVLVPREMPLSLIHLRNMVQLTEAGAIVAPAIPSFYSGEKDATSVVDSVIDRILDLVGFQVDRKRWGD